MEITKINSETLIVDGGYHLEGKQPERDAERSKLLGKDGYVIIRFTNEQVLNDTEQVIAKIKQTISELTD